MSCKSNKNLGNYKFNKDLISYKSDEDFIIVII